MSVVDGNVDVTARRASAEGAQEDPATAMFQEHGAPYLEAEGILDLTTFRANFRRFGEMLQNQLLEGLKVPFASRIELLSILQESEVDMDGETIDDETRRQIRDIDEAEEKPAPPRRESGVDIDGGDINEVGSGGGTIDDETRRLIQEADVAEKKLAQWRRLSGMNRVLEDIWDRREEGLPTINGLTLSLIHGVDESCEKTVAGVQESAVIAALVLSFSVPITIDPPEELLELDDDDWRRVLHLLGWGLVTAVGGAVILYAKIFTTAIGRAARESDKLEILVSSDAYSNITILTFSLFVFFFLAWIADVTLIYGNAGGSPISVAVVLMLVGAVWSGMRAVNAGHFEYAWRRRAVDGKDVVDDHLAYALLQKKAKAALEFNKSAWSVFKYGKYGGVCVGVPCEGITKDGERLLAGYPMKVEAKQPPLTNEV